MKNVLFAVAVMALGLVSLAQAVPSMKAVQKDVVGYEQATGQAGVFSAAPAVMADAQGKPVQVDWRGGRDGHRRGGWCHQSDAFSQEHHAQANRARYAREWRIDYWDTDVVNYGRSWYVVGRCRR